MKNLLVVFVLLFATIISAQTFTLNGITAETHVFAGLNIPTRDIEKDQFKFDYARFHVDLSNDFMSVQFRHDFASNKLQLANVSKTFDGLTITAGRFLDPVWYLYPAPHLMSQTSYPVSVNTFTVLENGISFSYTARDVTGKQMMRIYVSVFDCNESRNVSASIDALGIFGAFVQTSKTETGFGLILRGSLHSFVNLEGGIVKRPEKMENAITELYIQNKAVIVDDINIWLQGDFKWNKSYINNDESIVPANLKALRVLVGASYEYSAGSHLKLFYNLTERVAVAKVSFFL